MLMDSFRYFRSNTSCHSQFKVSYKYRCMMATNLEDCQQIVSYFNYFKLLYCYLRIHEKTTESCVIFLLFIVAIAYIILMSIVVNTFFTPILKILSVKWHLNEYLAGVTLVALVNSSPDMIANLMPISDDAPLFTCTIGNAVAIVLLCGGMVCYLKPFKMDGHCTVRNLLFLLLAVELVRFIVFRGQTVSETDSIVLLFVSVAYVFVNVADVILIQYTIKKLRLEIGNLRQQDDSSNELNRKLGQLLQLEQQEVMNFNTHHVQVDYEVNRTILHSRQNPQNHALCKDFLSSLNPIDATEWQQSNCCGRFLILLRSPLVLVVTLFVPVVDYERSKHGWSKLLNCTQIVTNPFLLITAVHSKFAYDYKSWYIELNLNYSKWSLCLSLPLAVFIFLSTRTDLPPTYHILFIVLSGASSVVLIVLCIGEIEVLTSIVGDFFQLSESFMDITFGSLTNATIDLIANFALTKQGYEKMAFAAICAGPFFSIVVGMSVAFLFNKNVRQKGSDFWLYGDHGDNCYIFIVIAIISQLWWCLTFNFCARRSAGIFSWTIFGIYMLFAAVAEWNVVHSFTRDKSFEPQ